MKRNILLNTCLMLLTLLMLGFSACSSATEENREYGDVDIDGDQRLDEGEFNNAWTETRYYGRWDVNNDSYIDEAEWTEGRDRYMGDYTGAMGDWDTDADQRLSEDEFRRGIYGYHDRDQDRMISEEEYNAWYREDR